MAHQVFVSHAREDADTASRVCKVLEADGISCWVAPRDVEAGTDDAAAILEAIRSSQLILLIFSAPANSSPYVLREIERAIAYDRTVLCLRIDDTVPSSSLEYYLNLWQWLGVAGGIEKRRRDIVAAVREQLDRARAPVRAPNPTDAAAVKSAGRKEPRLGGRATVLGKFTGGRLWIALAVVFLLVAGVGIGIWAFERTGASMRSSSLTHAGATTGTTISASGSAVDHNVWISLSPSGALPSARFSQAMAYDPDTRRAVMFGGSSDSGYLDDTWAYDSAANTWTKLNPAGAAPTARASQSMAYDPSNHQVVMFGGTGASGYLSDTWAYDPAANTWTKLTPAGAAPTARASQSMVYDPSTQQLIMFGGTSASGNLGDIWAYAPTANTWTSLNPTGTLPPGQGGQSMAYDPSTQKAIIFGGSQTGLNDVVNDIWDYDPAANNWTNLGPLGTLPTGRTSQSMAYDPSIQRLIMFGGESGSGFLRDIWAYDALANTWTKLNPSGAAPTARASQSMVYDPSTQQLIMFGGMGANGALNDTWAYTP